MSSQAPPAGPHDLDLPRGEDSYFATRRAVADGIYRKLATGEPPPQPRPAVGLALSGGGIRSATLSLGVLTALSAKKLIHRFDFLSTVSGGGYTGGFYGSLFVPPNDRGAGQGAWQDPRTSLDPLGTPFGQAAIRHLRENGRYLLDGAGDAVRLAVVAVRGWIAVQLVIGVTLLALFLVVKSAQAGLANAEFINTFELRQSADGWPSFLWIKEWLRGFPLADAVLLSWLWPFAVAALGIAVMTGWAFWMTRLSSVPAARLQRSWSGGAVGTLVIALACLFAFALAFVGYGCNVAAPPFAACRLVTPAANPLYYTSVVIGCLAAGALAFYAWAEWRHGATAVGADAVADSPVAAESRVRSALTGYATFWLGGAFVLAMLAVIDSIAQTVYHLWLWDYSSSIATPLTGGALVAVATPLIRSIIEKVQTSGPAGPGARRYGRLIALILALVLVLVLGIFWATLAEYIAWRGGPIGGGAPPILDPQSVEWSFASVWVPAVCFIGIAITIGLSPGFLNLSTFGAFYAARLRRAYLGARNPRRTVGNGTTSIETDDAGDDILPNVYYNPANGAPLHIINVTVNETTGRNGSALVQRDRKGLPLTLSPAGILIDRQANSMMDEPFQGDEEADHSLATWMGISGAAISTGLGQNTSLGLSLLAGLSNLRLGVWWLPGRRDMTKRNLPRHWLPVQFYLLCEFLGWFKGPQVATAGGGGWRSTNRLYLTDGGHFENTGIYELVRRRVPLIVACDNGADPDYAFADIVNLARKLRIDFNASLEFLPKDKLDLLLGKDGPRRAEFGEISDLIAYSRDRRSQGQYAAIARIRRPAETIETWQNENGQSETRQSATGQRHEPFPEYLGTLILLKPRLTGLEMIDLLDYNRANKSFPQQATGDQFFDEAQWESYYRLGQHIAGLVFSDPGKEPATAAAGGWVPHRLEPISEPWFAEDWLPQVQKADSDGGQDGKDKDHAKCACPMAAASAPAIVPARFGTLGLWPLIAAGAASLGALGVTVGVSQSLTTTVVDKLTTKTEASMSVTLDEDTRQILADGISVHLDADVTVTLDSMLARLDTLIIAVRQIAPGPSVNEGPVIASLQSIRVLLAQFIATQDPAVLKRLLAEVRSLRDDGRVRGEDMRRQIAALDATLATIADRLSKVEGAVRSAGPRPNARSGR